MREWEESQASILGKKDLRKQELDKQLESVRKESDRKLREESGRLIAEHTALMKKRDPFHAWMRVFAMKKDTTRSKKAEKLTVGKLEGHWRALFRKSQPACEVILPEFRPWEKTGATPPTINDGPTNLDELRELAHSQANHKAAGLDKIHAEVLKCDEVLVELIPLFNKALKNGGKDSFTKEQIPQQFFDAIIVALHKKGDVEDPNNYRGIVLMSHVAKLFDLLVMRRIRDGVDQYISPTQNAYRPGRGCQHHTVAAALLHQAAQKYQNYELHMLFVDFSKAFDSVDRVAMRKILEWWTIPPNLVSVIMTMLENHQLFVRQDGELSENPVTPLYGVLQGDTLAPYVFILCMDIIFQQLNNEWGAAIECPGEIDDDGRRVNRGTASRPQNPIKRLSDLDYSDDVVLLANSSADVQKQFTLFEKIASSIGMTINLGVGKTEEIRLNAPPGDPLIKTHDGRSISIVDHYKYLGTTLGQSWRDDFNRRKKLSWGIIWKYSQVWASKAPIDAKQKLFQALVEPALSYGAFTYPETSEVTATLHGCHSRMLRHCLGLPRANTTHSNHRPTEWLYYGVNPALGKSRKSSTLTLPGAVARQRLSALGHWTRDHYHRTAGIDGPIRRHPVIDVLKFDPSGYYTQRSSGTVSTCREAYQSAVRYSSEYASDGERSDDMLRRLVLTSNRQASRVVNKHQWYNECKSRVKEIDTGILNATMQRRRDDATRADFGDAEYKLAMARLEDPTNFTFRWLTRRTREFPLGEDRGFLESTTGLNQ